MLCYDAGSRHHASSWDAQPSPQPPPYAFTYYDSPTSYSPFTSSSAVESADSTDGLESDTHKIEQRLKQIGYGKSTKGYKNYLQLVPKESREAGREEHPVTPRADQKCSKRSWDMQLKNWRRLLHRWDPPTALHGINWHDAVETDWGAGPAEEPTDLSSGSNRCPPAHISWPWVDAPAASPNESLRCSTPLDPPYVGQDSASLADLDMSSITPLLSLLPPPPPRPDGAKPAASPSADEPEDDTPTTPPPEGSPKHGDPFQSAMSFLRRHCGPVGNSAPPSPPTSVNVSPVPSKVICSRSGSREGTPSRLPWAVGPLEATLPRPQLFLPSLAPVTAAAEDGTPAGFQQQQQRTLPLFLPSQPQMTPPEVPFWLQARSQPSGPAEPTPPMPPPQPPPPPLAPPPHEALPTKTVGCGEDAEAERLDRSVELIVSPLQQPLPSSHVLRGAIGAFLREHCGPIDRLQVRFDGLDTARLTAEFRTTQGSRTALQFQLLPFNHFATISCQPAREAIPVTCDPEGRIHRTIYLCFAPTPPGFDLPEAIRELEERCGTISRQLLYPNKGYALVEFWDAQGAASALRYAGSYVQGARVGVERHIAPVLYAASV